MSSLRVARWSELVKARVAFSIDPTTVAASAFAAERVMWTPELPKISRSGVGLLRVDARSHGRDVNVYAKQLAKSMVEVKVVGVGTANYVVEAKIDKAWKCVVLQLEKEL